ncbi:MAG: GNAT family N-acetyltransferase [Sulfitobacter sp.]|nr:GNAT family N-acetyltransferase [Sulfitobacter sp.]
MSSFTIRPVTRADLPQVLAMVQALANHHDDRATVSLPDLERDLLGPRPWLTGLVADAEGELTGYALLCPMAQVQFGLRGMDLHHLFVRHELRGQGVGQALLSASLVEARAQSCSFLTVGTHPDNEGAQRFYLEAGLARRPASGPRFSIKW